MMHLIAADVEGDILTTSNYLRHVALVYSVSGDLLLEINCLSLSTSNEVEQMYDEMLLQQMSPLNEKSCHKMNKCIACLL